MATTGMRRGQMPWARRGAIGYSRGMSRTLAIAVVQNRAAADFAVNLDRCLSFAAEAVRDGAKFVALPEYFSGLRADGPRIHPVAFRESEHPAIPAFAELARRNGAIVLLGSLGVLAADGRIFNRSYLIDAQGKIAARYDKLHLFDIDMPDGTPVRESQTIAPGADSVLARLADAAIGLSICYDLRFPLLYRKLAQAGAEILSIPAAFTKVTGEAHWHVLNRARAIENGCFVVAPCQWGDLPGGARSFGHSLIIDPWGRVLVDGGEGEGVFTATVDLDDVASTRAKIPSLQHDRNFTLAG
jgi:predicted amidohydrolase